MVICLLEVVLSQKFAGLLQGLRLQLAGAELRLFAARNQPCAFQHLVIAGALDVRGCASPLLKRARMGQRVGSASAEKARLKESVGDLRFC